MNHELLEQSWDALSDYHDAIAETYYERLLFAYPQYQEVMDELPMQDQRASMPQILEMVTWMTSQDDEVMPMVDAMASDLNSAGIDLDDMEVFSETMVSVIDDFGGRHVEGWNDAYREAWEDAFAVILIPALLGSMDKAA
jgi:hemoglobin-like flavoprotein